MFEREYRRFLKGQRQGCPVAFQRVLQVAQVILSVERGPTLEKQWGFFLPSPNMLKCREILKKWVFELGCVAQTRHVGTKMPVNGYNKLSIHQTFCYTAHREDLQCL